MSPHTTQRSTHYAEINPDVEKLSRSNDNPAFVIMQNEGVEMLLSAMDVHGENEVVLEAICALLSVMARHDDEKSFHIADRGGVKIVLRVLKDFPHVPSLVTECCSLIQSLALNTEIKTLIAQHGGVRALITAGKRYFDEARTQREVVGALCNLAVDDTNEQLIVKLGGVQHIVSAVREHIRDPEVVWQAAGALHQLGSKDENQEQESLSRCTETHRAHSDHWNFFHDL